MLEVGMPAPDFALANQKGEIVRLTDFRGKKVVIYFYPKDNTPGCTRQACAFRDHYEDFSGQDIVVIGITYGLFTILAMFLVDRCGCYALTLIGQF